MFFICRATISEEPSDLNLNEDVQGNVNSGLQNATAQPGGNMFYKGSFKPGATSALLNQVSGNFSAASRSSLLTPPPLK